MIQGIKNKLKFLQVNEAINLSAFVEWHHHVWSFKFQCPTPLSYLNFTETNLIRMNTTKAIAMMMSTAATPPNALPSEEFCGNLIGGAKSA